MRSDIATQSAARGARPAAPQSSRRLRYYNGFDDRRLNHVKRDGAGKAKPRVEHGATESGARLGAPLAAARGSSPLKKKL